MAERAREKNTNKPNSRFVFRFTKDPFYIEVGISPLNGFPLNQRDGMSL